MTLRINSIYNPGGWNGYAAGYQSRQSSNLQSDVFGSVFNANTSNTNVIILNDNNIDSFRGLAVINNMNIPAPVMAVSNPMAPQFSMPIAPVNKMINPFRTKAAFGSLTNIYGGSALNIHTPSVNYSTKEINTPFGKLTKTRITGNVDSITNTESRIVSSNANLHQTKEVIKTPTEKITKTRTRGLIWV